MENFAGWFGEHWRSLSKYAMAIVAAGFWATALAAGGDMSAVAPLLILGWILATLDVLTVSGWKVLYRIGAVIFFGLIFGGTFFYIRWTHPRLVLEPHLEATLHIDTLEKDDPNFHIELRNQEGPDISILQYSYKTPKFNDGVMPPLSARPIIPKGSKITLPGKLYSGILDTPTNLVLEITFEASQKTYIAKYKFFIDRKLKVSDQFTPMNLQQSSGAFDSLLTTKNNISEQLLKSQGTVVLTFPETDENKKPNIIRINTYFRQIIIDPITMMVRFVSQFPRTLNSKSIETTFDAHKNEMHTLIVSWDDEKQTIALNIDGKDIEK